MTLPPRILLIKSCREFLWNRLKKNLATDKEIRQLRHLNDILEKAFVNLLKPRKRKVRCENNCGFTDDFMTDEFGLNYFQAEGICPGCNAPTVYLNGKRTKIEVTFKILKGKEVIHG